MAKYKKIYTCTKCGAQHPKWIGRCSECGNWGSLVEEELSDKKGIEKIETTTKTSNVKNLSDIRGENNQRILTNISEIDRVLGGGFVVGSLVLLSGDPGIGKSTILAQMIDSVNKGGKNTLYISGEESATQVKDRFLRLGCGLENIKLINDTNLEKIIVTSKKEKPDLIVVDSIQTIYSLAAESEPGSISQIRTVTNYFMQLAKENDITVVLVGHITKDGSVAGPKTMEHMVDAVMYMSSDRSQNFRMLRSTKNRFGSVREVGIFEMTEKGLIEVKNPGAIFLEENFEHFPGSIVTVIMEGTRPFMIEVQALVSKTVFGIPQRKASGFDANRLQILSTVLTKRTKVNLSTYDIILNVVGGIKTNDTAIDLAVCMAIVSSFLNKPLTQKTVVFGEVGLGGEIRGVSNIDGRVKEAEKLGFEKAILPKSKVKSTKLKLLQVKNLSDLVDIK